jgi:hypothetical protein
MFNLRLSILQSNTARKEFIVSENGAKILFLIYCKMEPNVSSIKSIDDQQYVSI